MPFLPGGAARTRSGASGLVGCPPVAPTRLARLRAARRRRFASARSRRSCSRSACRGLPIASPFPQDRVDHAGGDRRAIVGATCRQHLEPDQLVVAQPARIDAELLQLRRGGQRGCVPDRPRPAERQLGQPPFVLGEADWRGSGRSWPLPLAGLVRWALAARGGLEFGQALVEILLARGADQARRGWP